MVINMRGRRSMISAALMDRLAGENPKRLEVCRNPDDTYDIFVREGDGNSYKRLSAERFESKEDAWQVVGYASRLPAKKRYCVVADRTFIHKGAVSRSTMTLKNNLTISEAVAFAMESVKKHGRTNARDLSVGEMFYTMYDNWDETVINVKFIIEEE